MREKKKVVITGGAGFIGSHLAEELVRQGYHTVILDNLSTSNLENIKPLLKKENVEFVQESISNLSLLQKLFQGVEYVFHQAAISSVPRSIDDPLLSHENNATGTLNVLRAASVNGVKKVIYASSSSVYGDTPTLPKRENMTPNPQSPYAVAKLTGEYYCRVFQTVYGLSTVCLRYFNVYGPRQNPFSEYAAVIPRFIMRVSEGNSPIIFGDGEQTRDFTFVQDVVQANILAAESDATGIYNIGTGRSISINHLAELIIGLIDNKVRPVHAEPRLGDVRSSLAAISRARAFGYKPKYSLEEGIKETIRRFKSVAQSG